MTGNDTAQILIVDDSPTNITVLLGMLDADYDLCAATSGRQALDLLARGHHPDLILLDVEMPDLDGYAVCAALKADAATRDIPVIFVTAHTDADSETRALATGGVDFIQKPVNQAVLQARMRLHLELERRAQAVQVLSLAIEQSPTSIVITGADAVIQYVNPHFTAESGYTAAEAIGQNPRLLQSGLTPPETFREMWERLRRGESWTGELVNRRKSGEVYWEEAHIAPLTDAQGTVTHYVAVKLDITERKRAYERIAYMAHHDVLTDLPNRSLFFEHVTRALELAKRQRTRFALLFIDLDRFKPINDTWGHEVGDLVLRAAAQRMTERVRAADTVGRIGGDEFVALLTDIHDPADAVMVAAGIGADLRRPFDLAGRTLSISASIGIAVYPDHGRDALELARNADDAMYRAKQDGRDTQRIYEVPA